LAAQHAGSVGSAAEAAPEKGGTMKRLLGIVFSIVALGAPASTSESR
jgi:hypothetical protein